MSSDNEQKQSQLAARFYVCTGIVFGKEGAISFGAVILEAKSAAEAEGICLGILREKKPSSDGWRKHEVSVIEVDCHDQGNVYQDICVGFTQVIASFGHVKVVSLITLTIIRNSSSLVGSNQTTADQIQS
jgi:hypothetical protein